jgi:hypothetical protein
MESEDNGNVTLTKICNLRDPYKPGSVSQHLNRNELILDSQVEMKSPSLCNPLNYTNQTKKQRIEEGQRGRHRCLKKEMQQSGH